MSDDHQTTLKFPASATGDHPVGQLQLNDNSLLIDCDVKMAVGPDSGKHLTSWRRVEVDLSDVLDVHLRVKFKTIEAVRNLHYLTFQLLIVPPVLAFTLCVGFIMPTEGGLETLLIFGTPLLAVSGIVWFLSYLSSFGLRKHWPMALYKSNGIEFRTREGTGLALSGRAPIAEQEAFVALVRQAIRRSHDGGMS